LIIGAARASRIVTLTRKAGIADSFTREGLPNTRSIDARSQNLGNGLCGAAMLTASYEALLDALGVHVRRASNIHKHRGSLSKTRRTTKNVAATMHSAPIEAWPGPDIARLEDMPTRSPCHRILVRRDGFKNESSARRLGDMDVLVNNDKHDIRAMKSSEPSPGAKVVLTPWFAQSCPRFGLLDFGTLRKPNR